jgi:hypothetical protein
MKAMALTRNFKETVATRVQGDPAFAKALLDEAITSLGSSMTLLHKGSPVTDELQDSVRCLTFRQLANLPSASRRARLDADECDEHFAQQLLSLRQALKF